MKSILSNERECYVCGTPLNLHRHHIWGGGRRKLSEKHGCWVYLCAKHHNMSDKGVHFNKALDTELKQDCQEMWEWLRFTNICAERVTDDTFPEFEEIESEVRAEFIRIFGRNYL